MKTVVKFIVLTALSLSLIGGCKSGNGRTDGKYYPSPTNTVIQAGFNDEVYVWENFIFSTNRVEKAR